MAPSLLHFSVSGYEDLEKAGPSCATDGNVQRCSHCGKQPRGCSKSYTSNFYDPTIPLLGTHPKELKAGTETDICPRVPTAALFTTA